MKRALVVSLFLFAARGGTPEPQSFDPQVERAERAMAALGKRLFEALTEALQKGGPVGALHVCRDVAQEMTKDVAASEGVALGRTSHRVRNPENAPREWARSIVLESAGLSAGAAERHVVDLGDRVGVLRPIGTLGLCTQCHGSALEPELRKELSELYPEDEATGFEVGDLRGFLWAEVPLSR